MSELTIMLDERITENLKKLANRENISSEELVTDLVVNFVEKEIYNLWVL